jgi:eukaryotic-like serine/threonine-protein kinase
MALAPGVRLGPHEILAPIGAGGMGEVWKARDTRLNRVVAIKVAQETFSARFEHEARAIAALNHPNICSLYDVGEYEGSGYLVMEYLEGNPLQCPVGVAKAIEHSLGILAALEAAHRAGIVHRDLKPANVLITKHGVKLLDFGVATLGQRAVAAAVTTENSPTIAMSAQRPVMGTPQYMAPEQIEGRTVDSRADMFAFGCLLYEMLSGRVAFEGSTPVSVMAAVLEGEPRALNEVQPLTPAWLESVVKTCLQKKPEDRWQEAGDLRRHMQSAAVMEAPARRVPPVIAAAAALAVIAVTAAIALLIPRTKATADRVQFPLFNDPAVTATAEPSGSLAITHDGRKIAFTATENGSGRSIWVRALDDDRAHRVPGTENGSGPFWSPDGAKLGFMAAGELKWLELSSGRVQKLAAVQNARGATWNAGGDIVYTPHNYGALFRVRADGGQPQPATKLQTNETAHVWPQFLPDGKRFLYTAGVAGRAAVLYAGSLDGSAPVRVKEQDTNALYAGGYLLFVEQDKLVAQPFDADNRAVRGQAAYLAGAIRRVIRQSVFAAAADTVVFERGSEFRRGLEWYDRSGKAVGSLDRGAFHFDLSPDEKRLAFSTEGDVWVRDLERGSTLRVTSDPALDAGTAWSPDGKWIYFTRAPAGMADPVISPFRLYRTRADGSGGETMLEGAPAGAHHMYVSPDGRYLLFEVWGPSQGRTSQLWALRLDQSGKATPLMESRFSEMGPRVSPDGRWLAYMSSETGRFEVYVRRWPSLEGKWQISVRGGHEPRWRGDGRELIYITPDAYVEAAPVEVRGSELTAGKPVVLFRSELGSMESSHFAITGDGQRILMQKGDRESSASPTVMLGWRSGLK